ncbi:hypothetical protein L6R29_09910 [Myxococcota bacterium]|nr:hypothetical protein [Myxococcota bacterium]
MEWFRSQWQSLQRGVSQWTGLGSIWRNAQGAFQHHAAYLKIGLVVLAFVLALWLVWSVVFHFAQTFLMLRNINNILGWVFLLLVAVSVGWLVWFIRRTLQGIKKESREARTKRLGLEEEKVDPTIAYLASLPKPPAIGLLDVIQPGARALLETLIFARDPASYEKALKELERQEGRDGRAPEWMLARAQILLHLGRQPQAYRVFAEVQQRYAQTRYAQDAALLELAARLEFGHEGAALPVDAPAPSVPLPSSSALAAGSKPRSAARSSAQEQDIFQQSTSVSRSPLLKPEQLDQMLRSPSADQLPQYPASFEHTTHNDSDSGIRTEDDLAEVAHPTIVDDIEDALSSLPSAFEHDQDDNYTLQTLVKRPVAPVAYAALIAPTGDASPTPPVPSFGILTPTPHNIEEEQLARHLPLLEEAIFSEDELEKLSHSFHAHPNPEPLRNTSQQIQTIQTPQVDRLATAIGPQVSARAEAQTTDTRRKSQSQISTNPQTTDTRRKSQSQISTNPQTTDARRVSQVSTKPNPQTTDARRVSQVSTKPNPQTTDAQGISQVSTKPNPQTTDARRVAEASAIRRVEAEIDAWLREHPPILGGILLEDARRCEGILEEADQLREAGQRAKAYALLQDILRLHPTSRYAKDAQMRLLSDQLFVVWEDSSGSGVTFPKK